MPAPEGHNFAKTVTIIAIVITIIALYFLMTSSIPQKPISGQGSSVAKQENIDIGGEFNLRDQTGQMFSSNQLKTKLSLIYFGFTFCPDICPTSLQKLTKVMDVLDKYQIAVTPVFITIDPERDNAEVLKQYLGHFHHKFIGLTGSKDEVKLVADKFKVYYAVSSGSGTGKNDYLLDHTSLIYLMDMNGKYMTHFHIDSKPEEMIEYIRIHNKL